MDTVEQVAEFFQRQPHIMQTLKTVDGLGLPDCWIGAGFLRNAVWNELHGNRRGAPPPGDVDVIYFDRTDIAPGRDGAIERQLCGLQPGVPWSARNQARMHLRNGDHPHGSSEDAMRHWPETATAIAARLEATRVKLLAPFGIEDLVNLIVCPTPAFLAKPDLYRARITAKNWTATWPGLTIVGV